MDNPSSLSLEFLIPTYCRLDSAIAATQSILDQLELLPANVFVSIRLQDDSSPGLSDEEFYTRTKHFPTIVTRNKNKTNLGMSANIQSLIATCKADFCSVLTDDDGLHPNVIGDIASELLALRQANGSFAAAALFVPRYSYLEDGSLYCIVCQDFADDRMLQPSLTSAMKYADNGFVLTGLFLQPQKVCHSLWDSKVENAFFPVIYLGEILLKEPVAYRNRNWFKHTVLNVCHWDRWGATNQQRQARLCHDYLEALDVLYQESLRRYPNPSAAEKTQLATATTTAYRKQVNGYAQYLDLKLMVRSIPKSLWRKPEFLMAFQPFLSKSLASALKRRLTNSQSV